MDRLESGRHEPGLIARLRSLANERTDGASLVVFRVAFGALLTILAARFFAHGWIREYYVEPSHFFAYWGLGFIRPLPTPGMYVVYALIAACGVLVSAGRFVRPAMIAAFVLFTFAHFSDQANYLNHYWLVSCLALVCCFMPLTSATVPRFALWILRAQVGVVYFGGGLAKLGSDWIAHAQPLTIWLGANVDFPIVGRFFANKSAAYAFSWAGLVFDLGIVFALSVKRTRAVAYVLVVFFHAMTARLFPIGMFPWIMICAATVFFDPSWPRRWFKSVGSKKGDFEAQYRPISSLLLALAGVWCFVQLALPLRFLAYPGNVLWNEQGFRFGWKVMAMEKTGSVELRVVNRSDPQARTAQVLPRDYLTKVQIKQMSTQPDMILAFAHMVRDAERARGNDVAVYVDVWVSLNGRPAARFVRPDVDLARIEDGLAPITWLMPEPTAVPPF